jgi:hypothetical protein
VTGPEERVAAADTRRLATNRELQDLLVRQLVRHDPSEGQSGLLRRAELVARFAAGNAAGNLSNALLENYLLSWGRRIAAEAATETPLPLAPPPLGDTRRSVLHVATGVFAIGGHSRVIASWIKLDPSSRHVLALTDQRTAIPGWLQTVVAENHGEIVDLASQGEPAMRIGALATMARSAADVVILHHHPYDVIPALALAGASSPVAVFNHADHVFWVGAAVCDLFVEFRSQGEQQSRAHRHARETIRLPLPIAEELLGSHWRAAARLRLGIDESTPMFVSMGSEFKYGPTPNQDFFRSCGKLLDKLPSAHAFIVGVPQDTRLVPATAIHERLHLVGVVADPGDYIAAADVYLDGFPLGAGVGLLEACLAGVVPVRAHTVESEFFTFHDSCLRDLVRPPADENEWLQNATDLILLPDRRKTLADELRERVRRRHASADWADAVGRVYERAEAIGHHPVALPEASGASPILDHALVGSSRFQWNAGGARSLLLDEAATFSLLEWCELFLAALRLGELQVDSDFVRRIESKGVWRGEVGYRVLATVLSLFIPDDRSEGLDSGNDRERPGDDLPGSLATGLADSPTHAQIAAAKLERLIQSLIDDLGTSELSGDERLAALRQEFEEEHQRLAELTARAHQLDRELTAQREWALEAHEALAERTARVLVLNEELAERTSRTLQLDDELSERTAEVIRLERELTEMRSSRTWRASRTLRRLWDALSRRTTHPG